MRFATLIRKHYCLAAASIILFIAGCSKESSPVSAQAPVPAVPVTVANVEQHDVPVTIRTIGNVEAIETVGIKSLIGGELQEVHFKEGQDVTKGDLLFVIDPRQAKADVARAEGNMLRDQAQAKNARVEAERYAKLLQEGVASKQQYDQFFSNADALEAAVEADKASLEYLKLQLSYTRIYAPVTGRTGNLVVNRGNLVKANDNPALVTINQITPIYVQFGIPEQQIPEVKRFMAAKSLRVQAVLKQGGSGVEDGQLTFIDNAVDTTTGTIKLKGTFSNSDRGLWPGQFVDVVLTLTMEPNAVVVPSQAVQTGQQGQYVFVIKPDMTAEMRTVTVKRTFDNQSVIGSGLQNGERVVTDGQLRLQKGSKVEIKNGAAKYSAPGETHTSTP